MNKVDKKTVQEDQVENTSVVVDGEEQNSPSNKGESKVYVPNQGEELEKYRYADTVITCAVCGKDTNIEHPEFRNVEVGINLPPLYTTNQHFLGLACSHCDARLTLRMVKAELPPAYDYSYDNAYDIPVNAELTWVAGDSAASYEVFVKELLDADAPEQEVKFESKGIVTEAKMELDLKGETSYMFRVDTRYDEEKVVTGPDVFISTKQAPVTAEEVSEDNKEKAE